MEGKKKEEGRKAGRKKEKGIEKGRGEGEREKRKNAFWSYLGPGGMFNLSSS